MPAIAELVYTLTFCDIYLNYDGPVPLTLVIFILFYEYIRN